MTSLKNEHSFRCKKGQNKVVRLLFTKPLIDIKWVGNEGSKLQKFLVVEYPVSLHDKMGRKDLNSFKSNTQIKRFHYDKWLEAQDKYIELCHNNGIEVEKMMVQNHLE